MCFTTYLLFSEYVFFKKQSEKLLELQEDYRTYVLAVNKVLHDYNKTKEKLDILKSNGIGGYKKEKKKEINFIATGFYSCEFPEWAVVFSSEDSFFCPNEYSFCVLNRDLEYLRNSALSYFKKNGRNSLFFQIDVDNWSDYTQYALLKGEKRIRTKIVKHQKRKKNIKVASYRGSSVQVEKNFKHDIRLLWPIERSSFWMSSLFGPRKKPDGAYGFHYGIDMAAIRGTPVYAAASGIVTEARYSRGYGNTIVITHNRKYCTRYAHLDKIIVKVGQKVIGKQLIGKVGRTGLVWKPQGNDPSHLHFELHAFGKQINPIKFFV